MKHWYYYIADFKPEAGAEFDFPGHMDGMDFIHQCKVTDVVPLREIAYRMVFNIQVQPDLKVETHVSFKCEQ